MKSVFSILFFIHIRIFLFSGDNFNEWFSEGAMRVDFVLAGDASVTNCYLSKILSEPYWGGSLTNLLDTLYYGDYYFTVQDNETGKLLYSRGFSALFSEWQTTSEADILQKAFPNSVRFPYPVKSVILEIFRRLKTQSLERIFTCVINPGDPEIERITLPVLKTRSLMISGPPGNSVDIVIIPEGYSKKEMNKFIKDAGRLTSHLLSVEPFATHREKFNIRLVYAESAESGTDIPGEGIWKNTIINSNFYTFGSERYLTSSDFWKISDLAASVPYDQIIILVNTDKYGGGGIYNFYSICSSDHPASPGVLVHEFGHAFTGLGDEYYTSDVAYEGFYAIQYEPWEPNLTTMINFDKKWKDMVPEGVPVPTPVKKEYLNTIGAFEGGGYSAKNIFRPQIECIMKSNSGPAFCGVCHRATERMIFFYTD